VGRQAGGQWAVTEMRAFIPAGKEEPFAADRRAMLVGRLEQEEAVVREWWVDYAVGGWG